MKEKKIQIMGHESLPSSSSDLTPLLSATPCIHFTPGVPTEDGWYVCRVKRYDLTESYETYMTVEVTSSGMLSGVGFNIDILSHAKLPEL